MNKNTLSRKVGLLIKHYRKQKGQSARVFWNSVLDTLSQNHKDYATYYCWESGRIPVALDVMMAAEEYLGFEQGRIVMEACDMRIIDAIIKEYEAEQKAKT